MTIDYQKLKLNLAQDYQSDLYKRQLELYSYVKNPAKEWKAVSVCLLVEDSLFFIKRKAEMPTHPHQIAMVGGLRKKSENNPIDVGFREFCEETNHTAEKLEFLGLLPLAQTAGEKILLPLICRWTDTLETFKAELETNGEWESAFLIPFQSLKEERFWGHADYHGNENWRSNILFYALTEENTQLIKGSSLISNHHWPCLWGATARVVWNFLRLYHTSNN